MRIPRGSIYSNYFKKKTITPKAKTYLIEGIGEDFLPDTIDFSIIDTVVQVTDKERVFDGKKTCQTRRHADGKLKRGCSSRGFTV